MEKKGSIIELVERLDRTLSTESWSAMFPSARLQNLIASISNHSPLLLLTRNVVSMPSHRRCRFENAWLYEEGLEDVVQGGWHEVGRSNVLEKLKGCAQDLTTWIRDLRSKFHGDIKRCKNQLEYLQYCGDPESVNAFNMAKEN